MSEFFDTQTLTCPGCKKQFTSCEGPLCSCEEDARDVLEEMQREREREDDEQEFDDALKAMAGEAITLVGIERLKEN
jgi:hypothetical protein